MFYSSFCSVVILDFTGPPEEWPLQICSFFNFGSIHGCAVLGIVVFLPVRGRNICGILDLRVLELVFEGDPG